MRALIFVLTLVFTLNMMSCATRVAVQPTTTKVVRVAPKHHKVVVVKGKRYYYWNGRYHKKTTKGYIVTKVR